MEWGGGTGKTSREKPTDVQSETEEIHTKEIPLILAALSPFVSFSPKLFPLKMTEGNMSLRTEMTIANGRCFH